MKALFTSRNLIGDGLNISPALRRWHELHPDHEIDLLTIDDHVAEIYKWMGVPLTVCFERPDKQYDFEHVFDITEAFKICDQAKVPMAAGYAVALGVAVETIHTTFDVPDLEEDRALVESVPEGTILFAPFSRSCSVHDPKIRRPNKTLPWQKWQKSLEFLRSLGQPIRVTGGKDDRIDELKFSEEEYLSGFPLRALARVMKTRASLLVSVDNGLSHLAGSQDLPQILIYPQCLGLHYAVPWGNPFCMPIQVEPVYVAPVQVQHSVKRAWDVICKLKRGETLEDVEEWHETTPE